MPKTLPIVAMRNAVLFPGVSLPITAARPQTLRAIEAAMRDPEHRVFAVAQRSDADEVDPSDLHAIGVVATLGAMQRGLGGARVLLERHGRGSAGKIVKEAGNYLVASVGDAVDLQPIDAKDPTFVALYREVRDRAAELGQKRGVPEQAIEQMLAQIEEPGRLADLVAGYL